MDFKQIKGIIFDYGGTIDTGGDHWSEVIRDAWQKAGVEADMPTFRECYVYAERELARTLHILPHHNFADLLEIKMNIELQHLCELGKFNPAAIETKAKEIAGICYESAKQSAQRAKPVIEKLREKYPIVLVSNFYGNINTVLKDFGLDTLFKDVIESAVVGVRKPDPEIFRLGVRSLGLKPEEVVVVGDSFSKDIESARKAGCKAIWIKGRQWSSEEEEILYPDTISELSEILRFTDGIDAV